MGIGGGGWISSAAFHPDDNNLLILGTDMSGCYYSTDRGGTFQTWSRGLDNPDLGGSASGNARYVDALLGVNFAGVSGFFAATHAGIFFRALTDDQWTLQTQGLGYYPSPDSNLATLIPGPFSSFDNNGQGIVYAGMGHARYGFGENTNLDSTERVWKANILNGPQNAVWSPVALQPPTGTHPIRDISAIVGPGGQTVIAVASGAGVHLYFNGCWRELTTEDDCWSIHLTQRGTLYAAFAETGNMKGVYRVCNVASVMSECTVATSPWTDVLDVTASDPNNFFPFMSVRDGVGSGDDIVYVGTRRIGGNPYVDDGLYRCSLVGTNCSVTPPSQQWVYQQGSGIEYLKLDGSGTATLSEGWITFWGLGFECAAGITASGDEYVATPMNGRFMTYDGPNDVWEQSYADATGVEDGNPLWTARGWHETGVTDFAFTDDNAVVAGAIDVGAIKSPSGGLIDYTRWRNLYVNNQQCAGEGPCDVETLYVGTRGDDVFVSNGTKRQPANAKDSRFLRYYFDGASWLWDNVGDQVVDPTTIIYRDFAFVDDDNVFIFYARGVNSSSIVEKGVLQLIYDQATDTWTPTYRNTGLPASDKGSERILYSEHPNLSALWLVWHGQGVYRLPDPLNAASTWERVDAQNSYWNSYRSIAASSDGSVIYVGTSGNYKSKNEMHSVVLKCSNPDAAAGALNWVNLTPTNDFGFVAPAFSSWSDQDAANWLNAVEAIAVHPTRNNEIYVGLYSDYSLEPLGTWRYDGTWTRYNAPDLSGSAVRALAFVPCGGSCGNHTLIAGLRGQEMYRMSVSGDGGPGGTGCPFVFTWDGERYVRDNSLLAPVDDPDLVGRSKANVADAYVLQQPVVARDGAIDLQIREFEQEHSWFDFIGLEAIDHPEGTFVEVDAAGQPVLVSGWIEPIEATTDDGADAVGLVRTRDGNAFAGRPGDVLDLLYRVPPSMEVIGGALSLGEKDPQGQGKMAQARGVSVSVYDQVAEEYVELNTVHPREHFALEPVSLPDELRANALDASGHLRLRLTWNTEHRLDFAGLPVPVELAAKPRTLTLQTAEHSEHGDVMGRVAVADAGFSELSPGQSITLRFTGAPQEGERRSYVLRTVGHYVRIPDEENQVRVPSALSLDPSVPNPFNPRTTIAFALPGEAAVSLRIYAVNGRLVRELFSGRLEEGRHSYVWDGNDTSGRPASSGVYYYRLQTPFGNRQEKMTLMR